MKELLDGCYPPQVGSMSGERCFTRNQYGFNVTWVWDGQKWGSDTIGVGTVNPNRIIYDTHGNPHHVGDTVDYESHGTSCSDSYYSCIRYQPSAEE